MVSAQWSKKGPNHYAFPFLWETLISVFWGRRYLDAALLSSSNVEECLLTLFLFLYGAFTPAVALGCPVRAWVWLVLAIQWRRFSHLLAVLLVDSTTDTHPGTQLLAQACGQVVLLQSSNTTTPNCLFGSQSLSLPKQLLHGITVMQYPSWGPSLNYSNQMTSSNFASLCSLCQASTLTYAGFERDKVVLRGGKLPCLRGLSMMYNLSTVFGRMLWWSAHVHVGKGRKGTAAFPLALHTYMLYTLCSCTSKYKMANKICWCTA